MFRITRQPRSRTPVPQVQRRGTAGLLAGGLLVALGLLVAGGQFFPGFASAEGEGVSAGYDLFWWTVDGGGHTWSEGGGYLLGASIGQHDAGSSFGAGYALHGGFWGGTGGMPYRLYLPLVLKGW